jgi:hypothetical protein
MFECLSSDTHTAPAPPDPELNGQEIKSEV